MNKGFKVIISALLSCMICFLGVGFAEISNTIYITGSAQYEYTYPVYITNIITSSVSSSNNKLSTVAFDGPFMNASISLAKYQSYGQTSSGGSYIVLGVTVSNATSRDYAYQSVTGADDISNLTIGVYKDSSCTTLLNNSNGIVPGKNSNGEEQSITFFVKLSHTQKNQQTYNPMLTFNFSTEITKEETEEVTKNVSQKFAGILNDTVDYTTLLTSMDNNYDGSRDWTATYIGNVKGSTNEDTAILLDLFDGSLSVNLDGVEVNVTCIVKRENVDGNTATGDTFTVGNTTYEGCEMTLYLTTAELAELSYNDHPTVYAMVFTRISEDSVWEQIGEEMYEGTAMVVGYVGGQSNGSFDTGTWRSSERYHNVWSGATIHTLIQKAVSED